MGVQSFGLNLILLDPAVQEGGSCAACQGTFMVAAWPFAIKVPAILSSFAVSFRKQRLFPDPSSWAYVCHHPGCGLSEPAQNRRRLEGEPNGSIREQQN